MNRAGFSASNAKTPIVESVTLSKPQVFALLDREILDPMMLDIPTNKEFALAQIQRFGQVGPDKAPKWLEEWSQIKTAERNYAQLKKDLEEVEKPKDPTPSNRKPLKCEICLSTLDRAQANDAVSYSGIFLCSTHAEGFKNQWPDAKFEIVEPDRMYCQSGSCD